MGIFDRLRGRGRYAAGTTPQEHSEETTPESPASLPVAPEVSVPQPEASSYVTEEDLAAAYGLSGLDLATTPPVDDVATHVVVSGPDGKLEIYVCDHRAYPGMAHEDEDNWRALGPVEELSGLGDSAFVNGEGTVFARLGEDWTVQVLTGAWNRPVEQTVELVRRLLSRVGG